MTQEALRMALEALERYGNRHRATYLLDGAWDAEITLGDKAITAIKEALAQEQEPIKDWVASHNAICALLRQAHDALALTSYPMKRTWVGLTDDEIAQGWKESWVTEQAWQSAVWWAEDKLRNKNT